MVELSEGTARRETRAGRPPRGEPIVFAHRGARGYAPENTIAAFRLALRQGATGLETDAWLAADGAPVLVHDETISSDGIPVTVTRRTATELAALDVPTLADLYASCGIDYELSIDIEHVAVAVPLVDVAESAGAAERLWLCAEDLATLDAVRERSARPRLVLSTDPPRLGRLRPALAILRVHGVAALNLHESDWTVARVTAVHAAGLLAFGWDVQTDRTVDRLTRLGIDALYGDWPDRLVARVRHNGSLAGGRA